MPFVNLRVPDGREMAVLVRGENLPRVGETFVATGGTRCKVMAVEWRAHRESERDADTFDATVILEEEWKVKWDETPPVEACYRSPALDRGR